MFLICNRTPPPKEGRGESNLDAMVSASGEATVQIDDGIEDIEDEELAEHGECQATAAIKKAPPSQSIEESLSYKPAARGFVSDWKLSMARWSGMQRAESVRRIWRLSK